MQQQHQQASRLLANLAAHFRQEGDSETADAIDTQLRRSPRVMPDDEQALHARSVLSQAREHERAGRFDMAEEHLEEAHRLAEDGYGATHPRTLERLWDLAVCRMRDGQHLAALHDFMALNRLMEASGSRQAARVRQLRRCIDRCHRAVRDNNGCRYLGSYMFDMIRRAQGQREEHDAAHIERLRSIGERLLARGRRELASSFLNEWISLRLDSADAHDELASTDLLRFTRYLRELGETERAVDFLVGHVQMRNSQCAFADKREHLLIALRELEGALLDLGRTQSARGTAELAAKVEANLREAGREAFGA